MSEMAKWTFMVYLAGDNNLSAAGEKDLAEMSAVGSTADVNIVAEFDRVGSTHHTRRYYVQRGILNEVADLGETDSGDPNVLLDFIAWAAANYPAERYALVLWNHGGGWEPSALDTIAQEIGVKNYGKAEGAERAASPLRRALFRPTLIKILSLESPNERAICSDDGSGHSLDTVELGRVLAQAVTRLGQPIDLLGMDACLMSNLEVAFQARPFARYLVASEESEPNDGWPYHAVVEKLVANPELPTAEFAGHIVHAYVRSYRDMHYRGDVTQAALDLAQMAPLNTALDRLAGALLEQLPRGAAQIWKAHRKSKRFWHNTLADIGSFGLEVRKAMRKATVQQAADEVRAALQPGAGQFVVAEEHNGTGVSACTGVTIYLPSVLTGISRYYADLDFAVQHRWLEMLRAYHAA